MENLTNLNERGQEVLDPTPLSIPVGFHRPPTLREQIQRLMRNEYNLLVSRGVDDVETPEEADDFDVGDDVDIDPISGHEYIDEEPAVEVPSGNLKDDFGSTSDAKPSEAGSEATPESTVST